MSTTLGQNIRIEPESLDLAVKLHAIRVLKQSGDIARDADEHLLVARMSVEWRPAEATREPGTEPHALRDAIVTWEKGT